MTASRFVRLSVVALAAIAGGTLAHALAESLVPERNPRVRVLPYPHHVPKVPDGVSLRFAMVQDVIHERYARHGRDYYVERNRGARADLARLPPGGPWDAASDDLAAGLDRLGDHDGAVRVMRDKFASQTERGVAARGLYSTYANLGTFLVHGNLRAAQAGDAAAKDRLREGHDFILKSIAVNPDAHFGREQWQAEAVEFLLAAIDKPDLLRTFDLIGNRLDLSVDPRQKRVFDLENEFQVLHSAQWVANELGTNGKDRSESSLYRRWIANVGAERDWPSWLMPSNNGPVPFDEPVLGIVGMWRENGPTPYFALCLGETMLRVGQRYLAWSAFERASRLAEQYWPDPGLQQFLRDHCRDRQAMIQSQLPADEVAELRPQFDAELEYGQRYQREYQQFEAEQIAAGRPIDDEHFYDAFYAGREPIASPVGPEDELRVVRDSPLDGLPGARAAYTLFGAGLAAFGMVVWMRWKDHQRVATQPLSGEVKKSNVAICVPISLAFLVAGWLIGTFASITLVNSQSVSDWLPSAAAITGGVSPWLVLMLAECRRIETRTAKKMIRGQTETLPEKAAR